MRIISGLAKGRRLHTPPLQQQKQLEIRPTSDRAREALFSILGDTVTGAMVLDLFAGCGSIGLEALSRGARGVVFVEKNTPALELIKQNVMTVLNSIPRGQQAGEVRLLEQDLRQQLQLEELSETMRHFDIIFADPPYDTGLSSHILGEIAARDILTRRGILVLEERHDTPLPAAVMQLSRIEMRKYGEAAFHFYRTIPQ
ncbi:16S rRNA (guanine(966)-N(2))-methyltransferase RsmD [Desulforhopalus vacuolatus]|uniref:16S rRNA (guanine(966)-N(2))-methyltransferase RsmD n=1 Tax=Desulforhopalus vacuolatus TaxID=40414 RepID=UPI0019643F41|nr:16S rRNA (guanine(966)-N(2))-methyltransferase RsmD [Desulforhopalus vacuolatus]